MITQLKYPLDTTLYTCFKKSLFIVKCCLAGTKRLYIKGLVYTSYQWLAEEASLDKCCFYEFLTCCLLSKLEIWVQTGVSYSRVKFTNTKSDFLLSCTFRRAIKYKNFGESWYWLQYCQRGESLRPDNYGEQSLSQIILEF